jgi:hypothetical protein
MLMRSLRHCRRLHSRAVLQVLLCMLWQGLAALLASICAAVHRRHLMMCVCDLTLVAHSSFHLMHHFISLDAPFHFIPY